MADVIRWYVVPREMRPDGRRQFDPVASKVAGSRCYAKAIDNDWALIRIVTDAAGHASLELEPKLLPLPRIAEAWSRAPNQVRSKFLGLVNSTDKLDVAIDKILNSIDGSSRAKMRATQPLSIYGQVVDDRATAED